MREVWKARGRKALVWTLRILAGIVALPLLYLAAAIFLGLVPANVSFHQPREGGVLIYVRSNGIHTDIVVPKVNAEADWRPYADPAHLGDPNWGRADHVAFGYGARDFYLNTPTWSDLSVGTAVRSMTGGDSPLVHVEHVDRPRPETWQRPLRLTSDQYRRLAAYIRSSFRTDANGAPIHVPGRYTNADAFYEGDGSFSMFFNCNAWSGAALRAAGVRMGLWTPFEQSVMWRLD
ncbi:MAG TPA: TIGR02117 family protein [Allosphingosinicella sp.]|nr:TIGR02117 family protein [Allosphingosinicella sp.]